MKLTEFLAGLEILKSHYKDGGDGYHIGAEHDIFYCYQTDIPLSPEEVQRMHELGWHQEEAVVDGEWKPENYDAEESWSAYT